MTVQAVDIRHAKVFDVKYFEEKEIYEQFLLGRNNSNSVFPNRDKCTVVYKALKANGGFKGDIDYLYFKLSGITYGQMMFALKAFEESGLIKTENKQISVLNVKSKVDLMNTASMKNLKGRLGIE